MLTSETSRLGAIAGVAAGQAPITVTELPQVVVVATRLDPEGPGIAH